VNKAVLIILIILFLLAAAGAYLYQAFQKFDYKINVVSYRAKQINIVRFEGIITLTLGIMIKSSLNFKIPVNYLFYEVYYKDNWVGRSTDTSAFTIKASPEESNITQTLDININKQNIEIAQNYINKKPTEFIIKVIVNVFGINIRLKKIPFTYKPE
jgi:hypothetical protein